MAVGYGTLSLLAIMAAFSASSCGDDSNDKNPNGGNGPASEIPDTLARGPVNAPSVSEPLLTDPGGNAIVRHVVRASVSGDVTPLGNYTASTTGTVERRVRTNVYETVAAGSDGRYLIAPETDQLAYFKVTNVDAAGATRVHNFDGVPSGYYMTFDTATGASAGGTGNTATTECRDIAVRILGLPAEKKGDHRLLINGQVISSPVFEETKGYVKTINLCAIDQSQHYLATVVSDNGADGIRYGFNFYQGLDKADLLEINLAQLATTVTWSADHAINDAYSLAAQKNGWSRRITLYSPRAVETASFSQNGTFPGFDAIPLDSLRFISTTQDDNTGAVTLQRDVAQQQLTVNFDIDNLLIGDTRLESLGVGWDNTGNDKAAVVTGVLYDGTVQTYAFMSMQPEVLNDDNIDFDIDSLPVFQAADSAGVNLAAGDAPDNLHFVSRAARQAGFRFWPYPAATTGNVDIAADPVVISHLDDLLAQAGN